MDDVSVEAARPPATQTGDFDAIIIGAGLSGMFMLYRLRELGLTARVFEAGTSLGGTRYWNRDPGARFDSESWTYGFSFSKELMQEWDWKEHFSPQPDTLEYLNYVADCQRRPRTSSAGLASTRSSARLLFRPMAVSDSTIRPCGSSPWIEQPIGSDPPAGLRTAHSVRQESWRSRITIEANPTGASGGRLSRYSETLRSPRTYGERQCVIGTLQVCSFLSLMMAGQEQQRIWHRA